VIDLGGGTRTGDAYAINNKGQVVGSSATVSGSDHLLHPFFWENGVLTDLGVVIGDVVGEAYSINDRGQVVGYSISDVNDINTSHALL
jgi:probable HAF family extracellular repeat protein